MPNPCGRALPCPQVEDALPRLLRWGLVYETAQGKLEAMPMSEAIPTLQAAWATAYNAIGTATNVPTHELITGKASVFGAGLDAYRKSRVRGPLP